MDSGLGDKLRDILNDPAAMEKIMQIVSGLSNQQSTPAFNQNAEYTPPPPPPPQAIRRCCQVFRGSGKSGLDSLAALAPALGEVTSGLLSFPPSGLFKGGKTPEAG